MSQYAYILVVISLVFLFYSISTRRRDFKDSTRNNFLKDETLGLTSKRKFTQLKISMMSLLTSIKLTIWELLLSKDITDQLNKPSYS